MQIRGTQQIDNIAIAFLLRTIYIYIYILIKYLCRSIYIARYQGIFQDNYSLWYMTLH